MIVGAVASTSRDDGASCGARPPCTFWYVRPSPSMRGHKNKHPLGLRDVRRFPALPRVRTTLCEIKELRMPNYAMLPPLPLLRSRFRSLTSMLTLRHWTHSPCVPWRNLSTCLTPLATLTSPQHLTLLRLKQGALLTPPPAEDDTSDRMGSGPTSAHNSGGRRLL